MSTEDREAGIAALLDRLEKFAVWATLYTDDEHLRNVALVALGRDPRPGHEGEMEAAHKVRDAIPAEPLDVTGMRQAFAEAFAYADHEQCRANGSEAEADCAMAVLAENGYIQAIPAEPLDVERLRRAYHVEYTSGDNECHHGNRWDCRDRAEETVHWDRLAALRPDPEPEP